MTLTLNQNMVDNDWLPPFSLQEYERRYEVVRNGMKEHGLDALIVYGAHAFAGRDLGQINAVYLSNYAAFIQTYVVVPLHDEPTMFIPIAQHLPNAKDLSCLTDVRAVGGTRCELGVSARLKELGLERGRIGVVGPLNASWWNMSLPAEARDHFDEVMPEAEFRVVSDLYEQWRLIKSDEELAHQKHAASINDSAQEAVVSATKPGIRHSELSDIGYAVSSRLRGNTAYIHMSSTSMTDPSMTYPDPYPTHKLVGPGEVVMSEHSVGFGGYYGKLMSTWFVDEPTKEYRELFSVAAEVYRTALGGAETGNDAHRRRPPDRTRRESRLHGSVPAGERVERVQLPAHGRLAVVGRRRGTQPGGLPDDIRARHGRAHQRESVLEGRAAQPVGRVGLCLHRGRPAVAARIRSGGPARRRVGVRRASNRGDRPKCSQRH